jgi:hypothetical protein
MCLAAARPKLAGYYKAHNLVAPAIRESVGEPPADRRRLAGAHRARPLEPYQPDGELFMAAEQARRERQT